MAIKLDYVVRETGINLVRNVTLTLASVLTVVVSLTLFGSALLLKAGADNANDRFSGGIEFIIYLNPDRTPEQQASVKRDLDENPDVRSYSFVDQDETYQEFRRLFEDSPQFVETVTPEILPPSYRVVPTTQDAEFVEALGEQFEGKAGVREVAFASEIVSKIQETFRKINQRFIIAAVILLVAALLLILNTIRVAMFARRREIEVMKLVGATNWFIRVPFVIEGIIQTMIGGAIAVLIGSYAIRPFIDELSDQDGLPLFAGFVVESSDLRTTNLIVIGIAVVIGAIGSAVAVSRFLDV